MAAELSHTTDNGDYMLYVDARNKKYLKIQSVEGRRHV